MQARLPLKDAPDECGMLRWNGTKPAFSTVVRVWGYLCYVKDFEAASKVHDQGIPCIHMGRSPTQPGWRCLDPSTGRVYTTVDVDFVEGCLCGITLDRDGAEQVVPPLGRDYDPAAPFAPN